MGDINALLSKLESDNIQTVQQLYKSRILKLINQIETEEQLKVIYQFIKGMMD